MLMMFCSTIYLNCFYLWLPVPLLIFNNISLFCPLLFFMISRLFLSFPCIFILFNRWNPLKDWRDCREHQRRRNEQRRKCALSSVRMLPLSERGGAGCFCGLFLSVVAGLGKVRSALISSLFHTSFCLIVKHSKVLVSDYRSERL